METQTYYFKPNTTHGQANYSNDGCYLYKIVMDEKNINIYEAPPRGGSWKNYDPIPSDDKFTKRIKEVNQISELQNPYNEKLENILSDNIPIITYYRKLINYRLIQYTIGNPNQSCLGISYYKDWVYLLTFLLDMKTLNRREYLSNKVVKEVANDYDEMINDMIENNKEHDKTYKDIIKTIQEEKNELEQKHIEMKTYFQNKIKKLTDLNDELEKQNRLLKREIKIMRLTDTANEIKILEYLQSELLDKEIYLENEIKNSDRDDKDKVEILDKVKILNDLYSELDEKIRVLNVKIDPTKTAFNGEYAGSDCYICDDYCHYECSCDCHQHSDEDSEEQNVILQLSEK